jgi:conserved oligomeric Golgi complex subunit 2
LELVKALESLWDEKVVLVHLGHRFWRSTLLLLKRFDTWIWDRIPKEFSEKQGEIDINQYLSLLDAVSTVSNSTITIVKTVIKSRLGLQSDTITVLVNTIQAILKQLPTIKIRDFILDRIAQKTVEVFNHIAGIPAQFRRTNRAEPNSPSFFMIGVFDHPVQFLLNANVEKATTDEWKICIAEKIIQKYYDKVTSTLSSMKKIEESLKRFKKNKKTSTEVSDEDKARIQLQIDCNAFKNELNLFGVDPDQFRYFNETMKIIDESLTDADNELD